MSISFGHPLLLPFGLLVLAVLFLCWRPVRPRRLEVATGFLWEVCHKSESRARWQRFRHPVSLAVQTTSLALLVLAAADPRVPAPHDTVLVLDTSASMGATDVRRSRLEEAKRIAAEWVAGLGHGQRLAIVAAGEAVRACSAMTADREALATALHEIPDPRGPTRMKEGLAVAQRAAGDDPSARIVLVTDGSFEGAAELGSKPGVRIVRVGQGGDNVAVRRLAARRVPDGLGRAQVLVEIKSSFRETVRCGLEIGVDGKTAESIPLELAPTARWQRVVELDLPGEARIRARLDLADHLAADNAAELSLPAAAASETAIPPGAWDAVWEMGRADVPAEESELRGLPAGPLDAGGPPRSAALPPVWVLLAGAAGLLLVVESWLFHRRWLN